MVRCLRFLQILAYFGEDMTLLLKCRFERSEFLLYKQFLISLLFQSRKTHSTAIPFCARRKQVHRLSPESLISIKWNEAGSKTLLSKYKQHALSLSDSQCLPVISNMTETDSQGHSIVWSIYRVIQVGQRCYNHEGIRTLNLLIRSQTPCPLGHVVLHWGFRMFDLHYTSSFLKMHEKEEDLGMKFSSSTDSCMRWRGTVPTYFPRVKVSHLNFSFQHNEAWPVQGSNLWPWRY